MEKNAQLLSFILLFIQKIDTISSPKEKLPFSLFSLCKTGMNGAVVGQRITVDLEWTSQKCPKQINNIETSAAVLLEFHIKTEFASWRLERFSLHWTLNVTAKGNQDHMYYILRSKFSCISLQPGTVACNMSAELWNPFLKPGFLKTVCFKSLKLWHLHLSALVIITI